MEKFSFPVRPFQKARPSGTLLFEKSKGQPLLSAIALQFETLTHAQEIKRSQRNLNLMTLGAETAKAYQDQPSSLFNHPRTRSCGW
jgi:hypothetical protein